VKIILDFERERERRERKKEREGRREGGRGGRERRLHLSLNFRADIAIHVASMKQKFNCSFIHICITELLIVECTTLSIIEDGT